MKQHYVMPIGVDDFREVREKYYYVDKTDFIKALIDGHAKATLITRPRRFGKTLSMSMLYYFFTLEEARKHKELFQGTRIETAGERYMALQGTKPVIFLSLKDIREKTFSAMLSGFEELARRTYGSFLYLLEGNTLLPGEKRIFQAILNLEATERDLQYSLSNLASYLARYHRQKVLLLIDEYDAPIQSSFDHNYYDDAIVFVRNYLSSVLKSNPSLDFAVLTGVLRIAKESIFSSLNNLEVASVTSIGYHTAMGFTYAEIEQMAIDFSAEAMLPEIKAWYDGYNFAGQEIYNPWSVINYFRQGCRPAAYWVNTSGNTIWRHLLENANTSQTEELAELVQGSTIAAELEEGVIYRDIYQNSDALYSLLLNTGYLTVAEFPDPYGEDYYCTMRIPNREIRTLFKTEVMRYLSNQAADSKLLRKLLHSLLTGQAADFEAALGDFLRLMASFHDTGGKESFYHGLLLGLLATLMPRFEVVSNRESDYGRFDIAIFPRKEQTGGAVLEFKVSDKEEDMPERAREALAQTQDKAYLTEFEQRGIHSVWQYGIAFCGKNCVIKKWRPGRTDPDMSPNLFSTILLPHQGVLIIRPLFQLCR